MSDYNNTLYDITRNAVHNQKKMEAEKKEEEYQKFCTDIRLKIKKIESDIEEIAKKGTYELEIYRTDPSKLEYRNSITHMKRFAKESKDQFKLLVKYKEFTLYRRFPESACSLYFTWKKPWYSLLRQKMKSLLTKPPKKVV